MHQGSKLLQFAAAMLVCAAAHAQTAPPWTTYQGNAAHTGHVPVNLDATQFRKVWESVLKEGVALQQVTAADGMVFVSQDGYFSGQDFTVLNALDGKTMWKLTFPDTYSVNPAAYDDGKVYFQTVNNGGDTWLRAHEAATGTPIFQSPFGAQWENYLAPTIVDHTVYMNGGTYGGMYAFKGASGTQKWFTELDQFDGWTPAVDGKFAYAYVGGTFNIVKRISGELAGTIQDTGYDWTGYTMGQSVVLGSQHDALAFNGGRLISFDLRSRAIRWIKREGFYSQPSLAGGLIHVVRHGTFAVLSEKNGKPQWMWSTPDDKLDGPVVVTNSHAFVSGAHATYAIDLSTRQKVWSYALGGALTLSEGILYIASKTGHLVAINVGDAAYGADMKVSLDGEWVPGYFAARALATNNGPATAGQVELGVTVPLAFGVTGLDDACKLVGRHITCRYSRIAAGETVTAKFALVPAGSGTYGISASVSADQVDPQPNNNRKAIQVTVP
jgi:hypothetical protein